MVLEAVVGTPGSLMDRARGVLGARLQREQTIRGEFTLVGQT